MTPVAVYLSACVYVCMYVCLGWCIDSFHYHIAGTRQARLCLPRNQSIGCSDRVFSHRAICLLVDRVLHGRIRIRAGV
jgi:hypothetical protein